jgi:N-acetylmuramoyl-L-alanine amidase
MSPNDNTDQVFPSPNHGDRKGHSISMVVLHYTGMKSADEALERMCDEQSEVSAHYMIEPHGRTHALVPEERRAWHAGVSEWAGEKDINSVSLGIELVNPGHEWGYEEFPDEQIDALVLLLRQVRERYGIPPGRVLGHSDIAPGRKEDPGEKFPWQVLALERLAIGPWSGKTPEELPSAEEALGLLEEIGYAVERFGAMACVIAFQRRFCPDHLGEGLSESTRAAIKETRGAFPPRTGSS